MPTATENTIQTLTDHLAHLIRMPTLSSDPATNRAAMDWIENQLSGLPLHIRRYDNQGSPSLVATTNNTKTPKLWLVAHTDVVSATPEQFEPYVRDGRMHGRGAHDMKFAIASFLTFCQEMGSKLSDYDLGLMFTADEEIGGHKGVKWLVDDLGYRGAAAIIPDSNGTWAMEMGAKGIMWWQLDSTGRSAHAGRAFDGINAIDQLTGFVAEVKTHFPSEPCGDPNHRHSTVNLATISASGATNQVPQKATATMDIRTSPDLPQSQVVDWVKQAEQKFPSVRATNLMTDEAYTVKANGANQLFEELTKKITGRTIKHYINHGSSDARFFSRHSIPTINITPAGGGFHVADEWMDLADLAVFHEVLKAFADEWAKTA
jgi:succinyl-diaminopimelate desuccinylase